MRRLPWRCRRERQGPAGVLGHSSITTTCDRYGHRCQDAERGERGSFECLSGRTVRLARSAGKTRYMMISYVPFTVSASERVEAPDGEPEPITDDPDDDLILACAVDVKVQIVVSGDRRHLLPVGECRGVRIVSPQALPAELAGEGSQLDDSALSKDAEKLLRRAYEAFNDRDVESTIATMHPKVDWPNGMEGGRVRGHREVRDYWQRQFTSIDSRVDPERFEPGPDGRIVVTVRQVVRDRAGNLLSDEAVEHHYLIADGLIRRMDIRKGRN